MTREVGLWIDHKQAVIVILLNQGEELEYVKSGMAKHIPHAGASQYENVAGSHDDAAEDRRDRRFGNYLKDYYNTVISYLRGVDSILIIGPGEAKGELQKRLENEELDGHIVGIENADKMTDEQITAAVRQYFRQ
jgi:hypothetical protein